MRFPQPLAYAMAPFLRSPLAALLRDLERPLACQGHDSDDDHLCKKLQSSS